MNYTKELLNTKIYNIIDKHYKNWFQIKYKDYVSIIVEISQCDYLEINFDNCGDSFDVYNRIEYEDIIIYIDSIFKKDYRNVSNHLIYIASLSSFSGIYI